MSSVLSSEVTVIEYEKKFAPSSPSACIECGKPAGKSHRSPADRAGRTNTSANYTCASRRRGDHHVDDRVENRDAGSYPGPQAILPTNRSVDCRRESTCGIQRRAEARTFRSQMPPQLRLAQFVRIDQETYQCSGCDRGKVKFLEVESFDGNNITMCFTFGWASAETGRMTHVSAIIGNPTGILSVFDPAPSGNSDTQAGILIETQCHQPRQSVPPAPT